MVLQLMILGLFPAAMAFAAASDLVSMAISNRLSIALLVGFFVMAAMIGMPLVDVGRHVMACLLVLAVAFAFFALGWIGGGDAKLAAATALWLGFPLLLEYTLVAAIFGGMLTLMLLQLKRFPLPLSLAAQPWITPGYIRSRTAFPTESRSPPRDSPSIRKRPSCARSWPSHGIASGPGQNTPH